MFYYSDEQLQEILADVKSEKGYIVLTYEGNKVYSMFSGPSWNREELELDSVDSMHKARKLLGKNYERVLDYVTNSGLVVFDIENNRTYLY